MIYEDYMEDFLKEARQEMYDYLREAGKSKEDVYKINYYMRNNLQIPYVSVAGPVGRQPFDSRCFGPWCATVRHRRHSPRSRPARISA